MKQVNIFRHIQGKSPRQVWQVKEGSEYDKKLDVFSWKQHLLFS
jgi:hypothetical protein